MIYLLSLVYLIFLFGAYLGFEILNTITQMKTGIKKLK